MTFHKSKYIAVDFDGTIVENVFPDVGIPVPGAIKWMKKWISEGHRVILWTCRNDIGEGENYLSEAVKYCQDNGVEFFQVNTNPQTWTQSPKIYANVYIDDKAIGTPLRLDMSGEKMMVDWEVVGPMVEEILKK